MTHSNLSEPDSHSDDLARLVGGILWITGLFESKQHSSEFVKEAVLSRIQTIERLAVRLESVFTADVTSSDMCLLFELPSTLFDDTRMTKEYEPHEGSTPKGQEKVVGTTEVGVEKCVHGRRGERPRTGVLLKTKVVLEKDLAGL